MNANLITRTVLTDPIVDLAALCPLCALAALSPAAALSALSPTLVHFNPALDPEATLLSLALARAVAVRASAAGAHVAGVQAAGAQPAAAQLTAAPPPAARSGQPVVILVVVLPLPAPK